jgi:hypothetical protein
MAENKVRTFVPDSNPRESKKVEFSMPAYQKSLADIYAEAKGFKTTSRLAGYAVQTYIARNPLSRAQRAQVVKIYGAEVADAIAPAQPTKEGEES